VTLWKAKERQRAYVPTFSLRFLANVPYNQSSLPKERPNVLKGRRINVAFIVIKVHTGIGFNTARYFSFTIPCTILLQSPCVSQIPDFIHKHNSFQ